MSHQDITSLKRKIASLGNINPNAIEEYNELSESYNEPFEEYRAQTVTLPNIELRSVPDYTNGGEIRDIAYAIGGGKR